MGSGVFGDSCTINRYTYTYQCTGSPSTNVNVNNSRANSRNENSGASLVDNLIQLQELYDNGTLSEEEFTAAKRRLLEI